MIYLIGGPPKCGKTSLAKQLSKSLGIPWVSTDTLQNAIKPYIPEQEYTDKFPSSSMQYASNDEKYIAHSSSEIIAAYRQQAKTVYPAIDAFVASEITDGNDHIIEGFHIEPDLIGKLTSAFPEKVRGVLLVKKDIRAFLDNVLSSTTSNDWILSRTTDQAATFPKIGAMVIEYASRLQSEAEQTEIKVVVTDGNFDTQLQEATDYLIRP